MPLSETAYRNHKATSHLRDEILPLPGLVHEGVTCEAAITQESLREEHMPQDEGIILDEDFLALGHVSLKQTTRTNCKHTRYEPSLIAIHLVGRRS